MARKKYSDYKADPTIKTPILAWFFNRGFLSFLYVAMAAVSVLSMVFLYSAGAKAWRGITTEPQETSPYQEIEALNSAGKDWAESFISKSPKNVSGWSVSDTVKPQNIQAAECVFQDNPSTTILSTYSGNSGETQTRVLLYGAGQASADFDKYISLLESCSNTEIIDEEFGKTAKFDNGFMITMGDAIVNVVTPDSNLRDELYKFYYDEMVSTLKETSCLDLDVANTDKARSFFYDPESYTGLKETTVVETRVNIKNVPTVSALTIDSINNPNATIPESPLPQDFPKLPENEVSKPKLPNPVEDQDSFKEEAIYNIADNNGPGCGWAWSAQKSPVYDLTALENEKNQTIIEKQGNVDKNAESYVESKIDWAVRTVQIMPSVDEWNKYAQSVNATHAKWTWLNDERDKLYEPWHNYVRDHNNWETFDKRKSDALKIYNDELQKCLDAQTLYDEWELEWGELYAEQKASENAPTTPEEEPEQPETPTPTESPSEGPTAPPTPTQEPEEPLDIPEPPENCTTPPERPAIIDQAKPAEPMAPEIPTGVTIPDSWEKP